MKALAIDCSPHMEEGNTWLVLEPFLEGMREAGADVEVLHLRTLEVNPCLGCLSCWLKTPGKCVHADDVAALHEKMLASDIHVYAAPLYVDGMPGPMKNLLDRGMPMLEPFFEIRDGHCRHPARGSRGKRAKVVLVSNCGFWEMENFEPLLVHMRAFCANAGVEFAEALLRPHGPALRGLMERGAPVQDVLDAAREAGLPPGREHELPQVAPCHRGRLAPKGG